MTIALASPIDTPNNCTHLRVVRVDVAHDEQSARVVVEGSGNVGGERMVLATHHLMISDTESNGIAAAVPPIANVEQMFVPIRIATPGGLDAMLVAMQSASPGLNARQAERNRRDAAGVALVLMGALPPGA